MTQSGKSWSKEVNPKRQLTAGIDTGSSSVKIAVIRSRAGEDVSILATNSERIRRRNVHKLVPELFARTCAATGVRHDDFDYITSTGDTDVVKFHTGHFYSMTTHARGALLLHPEACSAIDIGALHASAVRLDSRGKVLAHRMTSQCASGSGQFLENIARYLGVPIDDVGRLSVASRRPEKCSGVCAVLAETDVINMVSRGIKTADILKGVHLSIATRLVRLLRAVNSEGGSVLVTGGLAQDIGLVAAMEQLLEEDEVKGKPPLEVRTHRLSVYAGAIGAAMIGACRYNQLQRLDRLPTIASEKWPSQMQAS